MVLLVFRFFFCKQKTAYEIRISDWSSDVCSSDLLEPSAHLPVPGPGPVFLDPHAIHAGARGSRDAAADGEQQILEFRRVLLPGAGDEIGRASCRESVCQYV